MGTDEEYRGGCLCGAVRYEVRGRPLSTNICFCTQCQRHTGAPMPAFLTVSEKQFRLVQGRPASYRSSERAIRQFCGQCGSSLFWREDGTDGIDILLGTVDERERVAPPAYAIWAAHRIGWLPELEGIPSYPGRRSPEPSAG
jgi:hypothetical protein